jgi:cyclohexanone monooxygenase
MSTEIPTDTPSTTYDAVVVGAGFAGLYMLHKLRQMGLRARAYEAGDGVGGTWFWNRYPGARCDVESMQYSYSFDEDLQQEWQWTERYPAQKEILAYINHVADRFGLRPDIQLQTRVVSADFDEARVLWRVRTDRGDHVQARYLISAVGCLSAARTPDIPGLDEFRGLQLHTSNWPTEGVDLKGKRVGVIGTGSSGIQAIPEIARQAGSVVVFQRTANFSIPAWNRPLPVEDQQAWKVNYKEHRERARQSRSGILYDYSQRGTFEVDEAERQAEYERRWLKGGANFNHVFNDIFVNAKANDLAAEFVRGKIRGIVKDPEVAEKLSPRGYALGTKRLCVDTNYYATFNLPDVQLHDLRAAPIERFTATGVQTASGEYPLDAIVFATGFDAVTGAIERIDIRGRGGRLLKDKWSEGPRAYLGLMVAGYPNLFTITGPGSPSILTNVIVSIEQHVEWIAALLERMRAQGDDLVEAKQAAEDGWVRHVAEVAEGTLFTTTNSWYMGANVPGKPRVFLPYGGGFQKYVVFCNDEAKAGYPNFTISKGA